MRKVYCNFVDFERAVTMQFLEMRYGGRGRGIMRICWSSNVSNADI